MGVLDDPLTLLVTCPAKVKFPLPSNVIMPVALVAEVIAPVLGFCPETRTSRTK